MNADTVAVEHTRKQIDEKPCPNVIHVATESADWCSSNARECTGKVSRFYKFEKPGPKLGRKMYVCSLSFPSLTFSPNHPIPCPSQVTSFNSRSPQPLPRAVLSIHQRNHQLTSACLTHSRKKPQIQQGNKDHQKRERMLAEKEEGDRKYREKRYKKKKMKKESFERGEENVDL